MVDLTKGNRFQETSGLLKCIMPRLYVKKARNTTTLAEFLEPLYKPDVEKETKIQ